jgi:hypothetical protein
MRICAVQLAHAIRKMPVDCFNHQVIMIGHLAKSMHNEIAPCTYFAQNCQPDPTIGIVAKNRTTAIAA